MFIIDSLSGLHIPFYKMSFHCKKKKPCNKYCCVFFSFYLTQLSFFQSGYARVVFQQFREFPYHHHFIGKILDEVFPDVFGEPFLSAGLFRIVAQYLRTDIGSSLHPLADQTRIDIVCAIILILYIINKE